MQVRFYAVLILSMMMMACQKHENSSSGRLACKPVVSEVPTKMPGTTLVLPVGTNFCLSADEMELHIELPKGFSFVTSNKLLPIYATYTCRCSREGNPCKVFYTAGLGFGCLQSSCTGSCTGQFTYQSYNVEKIISTQDATSFFSNPEIQTQIEAQLQTDEEPMQEIYGMYFFAIVRNNHRKEAKASCNCEGTKACTLKTVTLRTSGIKIYYCEGNCNGCELTVE